MFDRNEDQSLLADSVEKFITRHYGDEARMAMGDTSLNDTIWGEVAEQGWLMLPFTEDFGGLRQDGETGAGDMATLFESMGGGLMVEPVLASSILAGGLLFHSPDASNFQDLIAELAAGSKLASAALHEPRTRHDLAYCETTASGSGDSWSLSGAKSLALGGSDADTFIVLARVSGNPGDGIEGLGLFAIEKDAAGLEVKPYKLRDDHWAADLKLDGATATLVAGPGDSETVLNTALAKTRLCLAAEAVGVADRAMSLTLDYAKERRQFGKSLAEFQVIQHYLVDMSNQLENMRSLVYAAVFAAENGWTESATKAINRAFKASKELGVPLSKKAVQIHGGMGMSEEMPLGRLLRRQLAISLLYPA
jgi:alkylation response protein AidB-like acyl-CoA dehydrogenase